MRYALLAMLLVACERERAERSPRAETSAAGDTAPAVAASPAAAGEARAACPATGRWSQCALIERLERAGLAPRLDSARVTEPPLTVTGLLVRVGSAELEVFIYPDAAAREREQSRLDRASYAAYDQPLSMVSQPTLIQSANVIAILHSRNDHQRERVADAITAGPPQPPKQ